MEIISKYKSIIILIILIIFNLFFLNKCNNENNEAIKNLQKENEYLNFQKDSISDLNIHLKEEFVKYDTLISIKEKEIEDMNNSINKKEIEIGRLKKERDFLNKERRKIAENKEKIKKEIEKLLGEIKSQSGEDLIKSLKEKLK